MANPHDVKSGWWQRIRTLILGGARNPFDKHVFHHLSLIAFFAWVGLGADGLSSSCYGPAEAFHALHEYPHLTIFVAIASAITVLVISSSYGQIIEQFPSGGGGYLVASKLLSPSLGMVSGSALMLDYVLTIAISIASGVDALFSFLPQTTLIAGYTLQVQPLKLPMEVAVLALLTLMNLRGVKETVIPLVPVFMIFVLTHVFVIGWALAVKVGTLPQVVQQTTDAVQNGAGKLGWVGLMFLLLRAYSMGAGTYTGIEAVSNGLPILREPKVQTGKTTMRYMAWSLSVMVVGLMLAYLLFGVSEQPGKTLNAVLFENFTEGWPSPWGNLFVWVTLISEALILFVAAQAGFLDGPRVASNMAQDHWLPHRFATLSDRLVTQNGVLMMGGAALVTLVLSRGSVDFLIVLYSINVFITFCLSQSGMVRHWWQVRHQNGQWRHGLMLNGTGLAMCLLILVSVTILKFGEGGWITILITGSLVLLALMTRRHYVHTSKLLRRLDGLVAAAQREPVQKDPSAPFDPNAKTAVLLVNGFNGLGLHTLLNVLRLFPGVFSNFVFVQVGILDAGNFKGAEEVGNLVKHIDQQVAKYIEFIQKQGFYAESFTSVGTDVPSEVAELTPRIMERYPQAVFFGGQLVFPQETFFTRFLHNYTVFALQRRFYSQGIPVVILPIRV